MSQYELIDTRFVLPSPAGTYYAISNHQEERSRGLLLALMTQANSQRISTETLSIWLDDDNIETSLALLHKIQQLGWLRPDDEQSSAPTGALEEIIPPLLATLCNTEKTLLADHQGFTLAAHGFTHEAAEELSALSADLIALRLRHGSLLTKNLKLNTQAIGLIDAAGNSQLGFWPLHIGKHCFTLVMSGIPQFNQTSFTNLIWLLTTRYGSNDNAANLSIHEIFYTDK